MKLSEIKIGDKFEHWQVLDDTPIYKVRNRYLYCLCTKCNKTKKYVRVSYLVKEGYFKYCRDCYNEENRKELSELEKEEKRYFIRLRSSAKTRNIPFSLTPKYLFDLLKKQNNECYYTKKTICLEEGSPFKASIDRKDSTLGYIKGNVQWVLKDINTMKGYLSEEEFYNFCKLIIENKK